MIRRAFIILGIIGVSLVLAFPLRDAVYQMIIVPAAYVFWILGLAYRAVPQVLWWAGVSVIVLVILLRGLMPLPRVRKEKPVDADEIMGQVETLSSLLTKTERGNYTKWLVANRLGKIAYQILALRETGKERFLYDPLSGPDWAPNADVQSYLVAGLHGSFTDFPQKRRFFLPSTQTILDHDLKEVVQYLESQVENK